MQMSEIEKSTYTVPVMIDRTEYTSKPEGSLVGKIKRAMKKNGVVCMTMVEVFDALISGQSIIPARLEGGIKSANWREQSLFLVDFDGDSGVSLAEARERYEEAGLPPAFAYYTFSHSDTCEKFRLAFAMDDSICNGSVRDKIMAILVGLSGGAADSKYIDRARYFNGSNQGGEYTGTPSRCQICSLCGTIPTHHFCLPKHPEKLPRRNPPPLGRTAANPPVALMSWRLAATSSLFPLGTT